MAEDQTHPTDFIAPSLEELTPLFPAYELEAFIAQGGMGAVYKARQISLDRSVAIKILPREFGDDPQFRASFEAEAKAMARLNHPNLISVYDFGDIEGMLYIIMEFVHGKALYYSAHNKAIDPKVALELVSTISRGLGHAHRGGIIHRDIKPANILLDSDATPKIGDFGLAHPIERDRSEGLIFGTPGYTAPEVFQEGATVDERSDIFSVGALLYELLCGRHPAPNSHGMTSGIDPRIDAIVKKATQANPQLRYSDVDQLANDLDELIPKLGGPKFATAPATPITPSLSSQPALASSSQKSGGLGFLIFFLLLLGGSAAAYFALRDSPEPPKIEISENENEKEKEKEQNAAKEKLEKDRKDKDRQNRKPRPQKDPMAGKDEPPKTDPVEPTTPDKPAESPMDSLKRLASSLSEGQRDEFPLETIKREKTAHFLVTQNMTWDDATQFAHEHGAHLAILTSSEDLKWFHDHFENASPVWIGASDSGFEGKWHWATGAPVDQSLWLANSPDNSTRDNPNGENFAAISPKSPTLEDHHRLQKFPFLLEWQLDGTTPASLDAQLARTGEALNNKRTPIFPAGTYNVGGSRFLLVKRSLDWQEASIAAQNAGGHLAVPSNANEAAFIALTLNEALENGTSCWIGGRRDEAIPDIWKYTTGEVFTFITWLEGQPDHSNDNEFYLTIQKQGDQLGANDEKSKGYDTNHFLIEWSVPALRNMPSASAIDVPQDDLLKALEEVRDKIRGRHGREYRKFRRKYDDVIEDFLKNTITAINNQERLAPPIKARLVEEVKKYLADNKLPDALPPMAPENLKRDLEDAREESKRLQKEYEEAFKQAKQDYLDELLSTANKVLKKGEEPKGKMFILENTVTANDDDRFNQIMDNKKVPLPQKPVKEEDKGDGEE